MLAWIVNTKTMLSPFWVARQTVRLCIGRFVKFWGTAALDKSRRGVIIRDEKGTLRQAVSPGYVKISSGLAAHRNRHLAEWRFLLFSFWIRIETE